MPSSADPRIAYLMQRRRRLGGGSAVAPSATKDATSNIYIPASGTEFTNLGLTAPSNLWRFHNTSSGNVVDDIGGKTLTMSGAPNYARTFTGWTSTGIGASGAAANQFCSNNTLPDISGTSSLLIAYAQIAQPASATHARMHHGTTSVNEFQGLNGSAVIRLRTSANSGNGVSSHTGQVRPFVVLYDRTNSVNAIYSDIEKKAITYAATAGTEALFQFGLSADVAADTAFVWACLYTGAAAEKSDAQIKSLLTTLGWTVSGY